MSSGATDFYIPYESQGIFDGGSNGIFVIPSNNLTAAPSWIEKTSAIKSMGLVERFTFNGSNVITGYQPYSFIYAATGTDGMVHIYGLALTLGAGSPAAQQIGNLSVAALANICDFTKAQLNVLDPRTLFVVVHTSTGTCGSGGDVYQVVHWSDSSTTAPMVVGITTTTLAALYQPNGALGGLILADNSGNLDFYASDAFTSPTVLTSGVTSWSVMFDSNGLLSGQLSGNTQFLNVTTAGGQAIWRVTYAGAANNVYAAIGSLGTTATGDTTNLYFDDIVAGSSVQNIYQQPIASTTPQTTLLYAAPAPGGVPYYDLVGSNGSLLVVTTYDPAISTTGSIATLTVGSASTPTGIGYEVGPNITAFMVEPSFGDLAHAVVCSNSAVTVSDGETFYNTEMVLLNGSAIQGGYGGGYSSTFENTFSASHLFVGAVLQFTGLHDYSGNGYGEAAVSVFNSSVPNPGTNVLSATGGGYTTLQGGYFYVPSGDRGMLMGLSSNVGAGTFTNITTRASVGAAYDLSKGFMTTVTVPLSTVSAL